MGSEAWSSHCATFHGPNFTPRPVAKPIRCFCGREYSPNMLANHLTRTHANHTGPVSCRECRDSPTYEDLDEWLAHAQAHLPDTHSPLRRCQLCGKVFADLHRHLAGPTHKEQFEQPFPCPKCEQVVDGQEGYENHVFAFHTVSRTSPSRSSHDTREPDTACDAGFVTGDGDGNGGCGSSDTASSDTASSDTASSDTASSDTASSGAVSNTDLANVEAWKLLGGLLSQVGSRGWSDSECLSWLREKTQAMQDGSLTGPVAEKDKRGAPEARESERIKRRRLGGLDGTDAERVVGEDGRMAAGDTSDDDDEDGSNWGASDDSDCSSDTGDDDDEEDHQTLRAVFQVLQRRGASNMAPLAATQNSPSASTPNMAGSAEPPPPYTSRANSPLRHGGFLSSTVGVPPNSAGSLLTGAASGDRVSISHFS